MTKEEFEALGINPSDLCEINHPSPFGQIRKVSWKVHIDEQHGYVMGYAGCVEPTRSEVNVYLPLECVSEIRIIERGFLK